MTDTVKTLGQSYPGTNLLTGLYTCGATKGAVASSFVACNQGNAPATFRLAVAVAGAADAPGQYIYYDQAVPAKSTFIATIGMTLAQTDVVRVLSSSGQISFGLFGTELT